jgi:hypothetical protein
MPDGGAQVRAGLEPLDMASVRPRRQRNITEPFTAGTSDARAALKLITRGFRRASKQAEALEDKGHRRGRDSDWT